MMDYAHMSMPRSTADSSSEGRMKADVAGSKKKKKKVLQSMVKKAAKAC